MSKALEAAANCILKNTLEVVQADILAKAAVLAYLRALAEEGPSNDVLDAGLECDDWSPSQIWPAMLAAHIEQLEAGR